jgi:hypothetical protein
MNKYIRFENGQQVEVTTLATKPAGGDWKKPRRISIFRSATDYPAPPQSKKFRRLS